MQSLAGSSYLKLPKELDHPKKSLINIQNIDDNECFKWSLVRHLNFADRNPARITKPDKDFSKMLDFKDIKSSVNVRTIHKIKKKKKKILSTLLFLNISTEKILKPHIKDWFKINDKQGIMMPKKASILNSENMREK